MSQTVYSRQVKTRRTSRATLLSFADDADIVGTRLIERVGNEIIISTHNAQ
ncbi:MAG: hypothetical protein FWE22_00130 [Firmicutes bacterium]|nr:hypothetical protein [Bacillota bacterium]